jgi:hypothetical protein
MRHAVFISGTEELLLVDETGSARIFSLVTEQFRYVILILLLFWPQHPLDLLHTHWIAVRPRFIPHRTELHFSF